MIIAIDGPSGTGKSTIAKEVAKKLGFTFFDTGAMYRSFACYVQSCGVDPSEEAQVVSLLASFQFDFKEGEADRRIYLVNQKDVTSLIRKEEISAIASQVATYPQVRKKMVKMQRRFALKKNAVFEGRDMGSVVFPDADLKVFLTAKPQVRAERRYQQLLSKFPDASSTVSLGSIFEEMQKRDEADEKRAFSPLVQASDAIYIDTSNRSIESIVEQIIKLRPKRKWRFFSMKLSYSIVYTLARIFFKLFYRLKVYGVEHVYKGRGLLMANHTSLYDPPILSISCPEEVHFLAKESLFRIPIFGRVIRMLNSHPVSHSSSDMKVIREMIGYLKTGKKLIIFPEGRRSEDGNLQPFEKGLFFLAKNAKSTVYPAYISGAFQIWPIYQKLPRLFGKVSCVFGSPILWDEFEDLPKEEVETIFNDRCSQAVLALRDWLEKGAKGAPP